MTPFLAVLGVAFICGVITWVTTAPKKQTCKHTRIEETLNAAALEISKIVKPEEWPRVKYLIEGILKKYFGEG